MSVLSPFSNTLYFLLQAFRAAESGKLEDERKDLAAIKADLEVKVQALMGKEQGMVKVGSPSSSIHIQLLPSFVHCHFSPSS